MSDYSYLFKFIIIGDSFVGKSCLLMQYTESSFKDEHDTTIGVEFGSKYLKQNNVSIKLQIWDTAGQETYRSVIRGYYRSAIGVVLVYDVTCKSSFHSLQKWIEEVRDNGKSNVQVIILGNKVDDEQNRQVSRNEGQQFADQNNFIFIETSAKTGENVEKAFTILSKRVHDKIESGEIVVNDQEQGVRGGNLLQINKQKDSPTPQIKPASKPKQQCC